MSVIESSTDPSLKPITRAHARRLRIYFRSAGWPCHDNLEIDLLNAGLIERISMNTASMTDAIRVTETGFRALGAALSRNRGAFDAHEDLVDRVARSEAAASRLVYRGLKLRGRLESGWKLCCPDVYSIRYSSLSAYTEPVIHEVKVRRSDLLSDLKRPEKRAVYQALSSAFYYVLPEGLASVDDIPDDCGVLYATAQGFAVGRPSPRRVVEPDHAVWMALARRAAERVDLDEAQAWLGNEPMPRPTQ